MTAHCYYVVYCADGCLGSASIFLNKKCTSMDDIDEMSSLIRHERIAYGKKKINELVIINWSPIEPPNFEANFEALEAGFKAMRKHAIPKPRVLDKKGLITAIKRLRKEKIPADKGVYKRKAKK